MISSLKNNRRSTAFTLIELLLAAFIFSVITLSIYLVFSQGLKIEERLRIVGQVDGGIFWAIQDIEADLRKIVDYTPCQDCPHFFSGSNDRILFLIESGAGLMEVSYGLEVPDQTTVRRVDIGGRVRQQGRLELDRRSDKRDVVGLVRMARFFKAGQDDGAVMKKIISDRVVNGGLKFSYFGINDDGERSWRPNWDQETLLPLAIRIELRTAEDDGDEKYLIKDVLIVAGSGGHFVQ